MNGRMSIRDLIDWLEQQDPNLVVKDGFGNPHSDRGAYEDLAFTPLAEATIGSMLEHAEGALGKTFQGYKGGDYPCKEWTSVYIGEWGETGYAITPIHFKYWLLTGSLMRPLQRADDAGIRRI